MAIPIVVPIVVAVLVSGGTAAGGVYLYDRFTHTDIEQIVKAVQKNKPGEFAFLRDIYFKNYPEHGNAEFYGFLDYFIAGVVTMRAEGELTYADYEGDNILAVQKVYDTYSVNAVLPEWDVIYYGFRLMITAAWDDKTGREWLKDSETQGFVKTMRNAWVRARQIQSEIKKDPEFKNEFSEFWLEQNATYESASRKLDSALPGGLNKSNIIVGIGILLGVAFLAIKR